MDVLKDFEYILTKMHSKLFQLQQGLEMRGLEECIPWRYTVLNWVQKFEIRGFFADFTRIYADLNGF